MSRENWYRLRGYREGDIGAYDDPLLSYASYAAGIKEVVLGEPMRLFHIDHEERFNQRITRAGLPGKSLFSLPFLPAVWRRKALTLYRIVLQRLGYRFKSLYEGIPVLDIDEYDRLRREIFAGKRSYVFNDENWGLGGVALEETALNIAEWDRDHAKYN